ncbi:hypothetical protein [Pleionea sp. CnH1-48]|uniref:hypothetical protein n=1 Tax=Pleionea sp. CnH1-48 TaxID=2954494 RepID=UPI0020978AC5|nr:hypothetical protein [Pleionea sp. CnH1-48]MCO7226763.1 hypothetical protein [Pleionea sp. CnH1-48]
MNDLLRYLHTLRKYGAKFAIKLLALMTLCLSFSAHAALSDSDKVSSAITLPGQQHTYSLIANKDEHIQLRIADTSNTAFYPRITLYSPSGDYITLGQGSYVGAISYKIETSGTHTVVVSDQSSCQCNGGSYDLYYKRLPGANEHGALSNGDYVSETIEQGDLDSYTFNANVGEHIQLRLSDKNNTAMYSRIWLYGPNGEYITLGQGAYVAAISYKITESGTHTVIVSDQSACLCNGGDYELHFVQMPGANEHGQLLNGDSVTGSIEQGDLDSYTFDASSGEHIQLRLSDVNNTGMYPRMWLYGPNGEYITLGQGAHVAAISYKITESGTHTVVISDQSACLCNGGDYELHFARLPGANEHDLLVNGGKKSGTLTQGDLDSFTFNGNTGEHIQLRLSDTNNTAMYPRIWLYGPDGDYITLGQGAHVAAISYKIETSGTHTIVITDQSSCLCNTGDYDIHFAYMPGANEHNKLISGNSVFENIVQGDLDTFTLDANEGEHIQLRLSDIDNTAMYPRIWLYGPDGEYITLGQGAHVAAISYKIETSGTHTVVVTDQSSCLCSTGDYELHYVKTSSIDPGNNNNASEHGPLPNGDSVTEYISQGDLDSYSFYAQSGEHIQLRIADTDLSGMYLRIWLYGPDGDYITLGQGAHVGAISYQVTQSGSHTVVVTDQSSCLCNTGNYELHFVRMPGANEHGLLSQGSSVTTQLAMGDIDSYTLSAGINESLLITATDINQTSMYLRVWLYGPDGEYITLGQGAHQAQINYTTQKAGTYTLIITDQSSNNSGSGSYSLVYH